MLFLYFFDVPTLSDDMVYRFMWNKNEADAVQLINNINDLLYSQWNHYFSINGRAIVHLLVQFFLVFIPPVVLQIINAFIFVVLLYLIANYISKDIKEQLFISCISFFLFFVVFQGFRTAILWGLGAFNYSWVLVATMMLLLFFQRIENKKANKKYLLLSPLSFIVGWSHEGLAIPLSCSFIFYFYINRKVLFRKAIFPYMLFFIIGSIVIMLSPGIWNRSMDGISIQNRVISGIINLCFNVRIFWLLLLTLLITWRKNKPLLKQHFMSCKYGYVTLLVSLGIILVCGTNLERVAFFSDYVAMLLLLSLLIKVISWKWMKRSMAVCGIIVLLFYIPAYAVRKENSDNWNYLEKQMKTPNQELISVRYPIKGNNLLMDYFREHYIIPSVEFGFYCIYMAFDSNDINMRCVARMYDKPRLTFLPEDIIDKVNSDSMAYQDYELDEHQSLFVWKLPEDKKVNKLTFILGYEDISKLSFLQRIVAYKEDTYELDDFHFEVVNISGNSYLIFTRPTTNIYRRINKIELQ